MFSPFPFVRYCLALIVGIVAYLYFPFYHVSLWGVLLWIFIFYLIYFKRFIEKNRGLLGTLGMVFLCLSGYLLTYLRTESNQPNHFMYSLGKFSHYQVVVESLVEEKANSWKVLAEVKSLKNLPHLNATGKVLLYLDKNSIPKPHYGDRLLIKGNPQLVASPKNPEEFDYKRYLRFQGIYHQQYLRDTNVVTMGHTIPNRLINWTYQLNNYCDSLLTTYLHGKQEYAVANAMILGLRDDLDNDLMQAYSAAGAIHVLSVSGLHVGIILGVLTWILSFLKRNTKYGRWLFVGILLGILWFYAFLTGLSSPVLRSTVMFSLILIAQNFGKENDSYNIVAFSAFVLLLYDPFFIMNVGFQLSYMAVFGMIYFQPKLNPIFIIDKNRNKFFWCLDRLWKITTVAVAAQIATLPITVYYFHQFPVYFLLANPLVIVFSTFVLIGGLGFLVIAPIFTFFKWFTLLNWLGFRLKWLIWILNFTVLETEHLPHSILRFLYLQTWEMWLCYALIFMFCALIETRHYTYVKIATTLIFILLGSIFYTKTQQQEQQILTIHAIPKHTAINFISGKKTTLLCDSALMDDRKNISFRLNNYWASKGITDTLKTVMPDNAFYTFGWKGNSFLLVKGSLKEQQVTLQKPVDYLILTNKSVKKWEEIADISFKNLVLDGSFSPYYGKILTQEAQVRNIPCYNVVENGAFILEK